MYFVFLKNWYLNILAQSPSGLIIYFRAIQKIDFFKFTNMKEILFHLMIYFEIRHNCFINHF